MHDDLKSAGIDLVAITGMPGDNKAQVEEKESMQLKYDVRPVPFNSDLEGVYKIAGLGDFWTTKHDDNFGGYEMVQPAVVVLDADGAVVLECLWSWKTMGRTGRCTTARCRPWTASGSCTWWSPGRT